MKPSYMNQLAVPSTFQFDFCISLVPTVRTDGPVLVIWEYTKGEKVWQCTVVKEKSFTVLYSIVVKKRAIKIFS